MTGTGEMQSVWGGGAYSRHAAGQQWLPNKSAPPSLYILPARPFGDVQAAELAKELSNAELTALSAELESQLTILGDRNLAALRVLKASLKDPQLRRLSIFYGAAHMAGIERAIVSDFGFKKVGERWLDAWIIL